MVESNSNKNSNKNSDIPLSYKKIIDFYKLKDYTIEGNVILCDGKEYHVIDSDTVDHKVKISLKGIKNIY